MAVCTLVSCIVFCADLGGLYEEEAWPGCTRVSGVVQHARSDQVLRWDCIPDIVSKVKVSTVLLKKVEVFVFLSFFVIQICVVIILLIISLYQCIRIFK